MAIFARFAYAAGANVVGLLLLRFAIAGAMLAAWMLLTRRPWPRGRALAVAIAMGAVGYVGQAVCYFSALGHASAGLVALLLYVYPTLVCLLAALFLHERLAGSQVAWLVLNFAGIALTVGAGHGIVRRSVGAALPGWTSGRAASSRDGGAVWEVDG